MKSQVFKFYFSQNRILKLIARSSPYNCDAIHFNVFSVFFSLSVIMQQILLKMQQT